MITNLFDQNRKDKKPWSRQDSITSCKLERERNEAFERFRRPTGVIPRFAVTKRVGKNFHIVGIGKVEVATFADLKDVARELGFTDLKFGAIKTAL